MSSQTEAERTEETLAPGTRFGRYEVIRCIGAGGMGAVYEATHTGLGKRVALKVLHSNFVTNDSMRARFVREGEAIARIRHPNVVDVLDVGVEGRSPYLVMEYLEGESLLEHLDKNGAMDERTVANLLVPIVAGLVAAHESDVIHRDMKPDNVLLAREGKNIVPKLLDFGISKVTKTTQGELALTQQVVLGTPYYMAPEQAQQTGPLDERVDQYAVGVMMYECATHELPYNGASLFDLMTKIVAGKCRPPSEIKPGMDPRFEAIVLRAMAREASDRYPTLEELGRDLIEFAGNRVRAQHGPSFGLAPDTLPPPSGTTGEIPTVNRTSRTSRNSSRTSSENATPVAARTSGETLRATIAGRKTPTTRTRSEPVVTPASPGAEEKKSRVPALAMIALMLLGLSVLGAWYVLGRDPEVARPQPPAHPIEPTSTAQREARQPAAEPPVAAPPEPAPTTATVTESPVAAAQVDPVIEPVVEPPIDTHARRRPSRHATVAMDPADSPAPAAPDLDIRLER